MPIRYLETTTDYRDEKSGELGGLNRVRALTQDDSHVFCRPDQIEQEVNNLLATADEFYKTVGMKLRVRLSYRDESDAYIGSMELWQSAQKQLKEAVVANKLDFYEQEGEAAFYGPKIDFMAMDAIGREHQVATVQLDFIQPQRFNLEYTGADSTPEQPVMIHCALMGSIERFLSVYIEHTAGKFPVWVAPEQIRISSVNQEDDTLTFVAKLEAEAIKHGLRVVVDNANESVGKKIRNAEKDKVPYMLVIGDKERETGEVTARVRGDLQVQEPTAMKFENFFQSVANEAKSRVSRSSL
jgi:threonyl-tRNA synthetase